MGNYRSKMAGLWRSYSKLVERFPWGTNILQTGVLCATGDVIAQFAVERRRLEVGWLKQGKGAAHKANNRI